jgi:hypothetical protein
MDMIAFWKLIEHSGTVAADRDAREGWLVEELGRLSENEVLGFDVWLDRETARAMTWRMWGAADWICGWCSDDRFKDFCVWLVSLGRESFEHVVADADNLADLPMVRRLAERPRSAWSSDDEPTWESLAYVASRAYERFSDNPDDFYRAVDTYRSSGGDLPVVPDVLTDERWDFLDSGQTRVRLPRIAALFPSPHDGKAAVIERQASIAPSPDLDTVAFDQVAAFLDSMVDQATDALILDPYDDIGRRTYKEWHARLATLIGRARPELDDGWAAIVANSLLGSLYAEPARRLLGDGQSRPVAAGLRRAAVVFLNASSPPMHARSNHTGSDGRSVR